MQLTLMIILHFVATCAHHNPLVFSSHIADNFNHLHPHSYFLHKALIFFFLLEFTSKLVKSEGSSM
ncbi:hypothetical protein Hanom_Chr05g00450251 [Helianthus anomalus]